MGGRAAAKVASAFSIMDEPLSLITYLDACDAAHDVVESDLLLQHVVRHVTHDLEAAPTSELDQVKYRVVWTSPAPYMRNRQGLLATTIRDQSRKENIIIRAGGGDEDASLDQEDDRSY
jgi:hypothetical protein